MNFLKVIFYSGFFKNYISLFLIFFSLSNIFFVKADENAYLIKNNQEKNKLKEFYSHNGITYTQHDRADSQLKMFFGFDPENPETSFYPDLSTIEDSDSIRDMYKLKLSDMTINKINYSIKR